MWEIMWAIAQSGRPNRTQPCFLSEMTHEFKGMKEVLRHNNLDNALKWKTKEGAIKHFTELPNWAKGKYEVVKIIFLVTGWHYYQDFYEDIKSEFYEVRKTDYESSKN